MRHSLACLLALAAVASGCGKAPLAPGAMTLIGDGAAFGKTGPAPVDLGLYYAFDDYNKEDFQVKSVQRLHQDIAGALQPTGPSVFLSADMQQAPDFRTRITPGQAWQQNFSAVGELHTDLTSSLRDFLVWMEAGAKRSTHLEILTHGGASHGMLWDYNDDPSNPQAGHVTLQNIARGIEKGHKGGRLPNLDLDACMMASIEVGAALEGTVEVYSGCEDFGISNSTPYGRIVTDVQAGQGATPDAWGHMMVDEIVHHGNWGDKGTRTWSAVRLDSSFDHLVKDVDRLSLSLAAAMKTEPDGVRRAIATTQTFYWMQQYIAEFGDFHQRDLIDFCSTLEANVKDPHVLADARAVAADVPTVLAAFDKDPSETSAHGLAIYLPSYAGRALSQYRGTTFARHTHWADFLATLGPAPAR